ncbi:MAG: twin-arginine translocation signal domain-containing protein, partial [Rhodospirillales bacterium]|nr:twin-arginine translocation signal domain-containing protein [Rhodospirillales bacterium]
MADDGISRRDFLNGTLIGAGGILIAANGSIRPAIAIEA